MIACMVNIDAVATDVYGYPVEEDVKVSWEYGGCPSLKHYNPFKLTAHCKAIEQAVRDALNDARLNHRDMEAQG